MKRGVEARDDFVIGPMMRRRPDDVVLTPDGLARHRRDYLDAIRAYNAEGKAARTWPIQFLVRRTAHHVMDHAWEMEDRDPGS